MDNFLRLKVRDNKTTTEELMPLYYLGIHRQKKNTGSPLFLFSFYFSVSLTCFLTVRHQSPDNKIGPHSRRPIISVATFP
jgi:hypothetical protein